MRVSTLLIPSATLILLAFVPTAAAHQDGCIIAQHVGTVQVHQLCFTNPETCLSNVQAGSVEVNVHCAQPEGQTCALKVHAPPRHECV